MFPFSRTHVCVVVGLLMLSVMPIAQELPSPLSAEDVRPVNDAQAKLGQLLFFDRLLSGNQNIACSTCHHPSLGSADGLSLGIGEGGEGIGNERTFGDGTSKAGRRVPRNAPALWNLGAREFKTLFHDGRISHSDVFESGFDSPAEEFLPVGLSDIVAVQAMFPLTAGVEMAGDKNENEVPGAVDRRVDYAWRLITERVQNVPAYLSFFQDAYDDVSSARDISIVHIANAISAFERFEFEASNSPFDRYLEGDLGALTEQQVNGLNLFYGEANCVQCHSGALQTDHRFHNLALPFIGPGRTRMFDFKARDMGRINETDMAVDAYKFRTPSLRNISETAPYGHNGAYTSLEDMVRHHLNPVESFENYSIEFATLPSAAHLNSDTLLWADDQEKQRLLSTVTDYRSHLSDEQIDSLVAFLAALTDEESLNGRLGIPEAVPSGLPIE